MKLDSFLNVTGPNNTREIKTISLLIDQFEFEFQENLTVATDANCELLVDNSPPHFLLMLLHFYDPFPSSLFIFIAILVCLKIEIRDFR